MTHHRPLRRGGGSDNSNRERDRSGGNSRGRRGVGLGDQRRPARRARRSRCSGETKHVNLYLVRHGETAHNRDGVGLGRRDEPLTELGRAQAAAVADQFRGVRLDRVLASPLSRASETARAIATVVGLDLEIRNDLIEMDIGLTEGMAFSAVRERFPEFMAEWAGPNVAGAVMPGGESLEDVALRLVPLVEELRGFPPESGVVVVSHNFVLKVLLCSLLNVQLASFRSFEIGLASVSTLSLRGRRANVVALNDTCHLVSLNLDPARRSL